jgi:16S rRNA C967 or C1407 C5-methylase (RsmB/RsmF family)
VVANDRSKKKMLGVSGLMKMQGFDNVKCISTDATKLCADDDSGVSVSDVFLDAKPNEGGLYLSVKKLPLEGFTHILLDPPCSALGLRPRLHLPSNDDVAEYCVYQRGFVDQAIKLLKVGGVLCYSTCTYNPDENEGITAHILSKYPEMALVDVGVDLGKPGIDWPGLTMDDRRKVRRFDWCNADSETREDMAGSR